MMAERIDLLAWDSSFFAQKVGRCTLAHPQQLPDLMHEAESRGYSLLYIESQHILVGHCALPFSLLDVGGQIRYAKNLLPLQQVPRPDAHIVSCSRHDLHGDVLSLAYLSGSLSRFRSDKNLPAGSFERLYRSWLLKTLERLSTGAVYIYRVSGQPVGLITSEWDNGVCTIGLLAVHPSWQGQGIATRLIHHVESLCFQNDLRRLEVKTQLINIGARALYAKNSFSESEQSRLYHAHILAR
jgi:dTDP-4-amino-4,6-dideoxy-D-galactose acyltransferase